LLGPKGPFARALPGYESRPGQLEMAVAVERALSEEHVLLCEAGTGTGKTLAYLVPALLSGRRVVVSTATRALQEQILGKDVPLIREVLGIEPRVAVMKGLSNYVCLRRLAHLEQSAEAARPNVSKALGTIRSWLETTERGDVGEVTELEQRHPIFSEIVSASDTRLGPPCPYYQRCYVTRMRQEAERAQVVVVNHHLFFADLALRGPHPGRVLPDYDAVVLDEAHQIEDIATDFFGDRLSSAGLERLLNDSERSLCLPLLRTASSTATDPEPLIRHVREAAVAFWRALAPAASAAQGRMTLEPDAWHGQLERAWLALDTALEAVGTNLERSATAASDNAALGQALELGARRVQATRDGLASIVEGAPGRVTWFEQSQRNSVLSSSPIDLSGVLRDRLFDTVPSVVLTSATLATGAGRQDGSGSGAFSYVRRCLGLEAPGLCIEERVIPSPFDFAGRALLYVPRSLPPPGSGDFTRVAADHIRELIELSDGGAFVLTTSIRSMSVLFERLRAALPGRPVLVQGSTSKQALLEQFRASGRAVLVATMSFWEGVDVPGQALRLVVLEKVPFPVPTDPIVRARGLALESEGQSAFAHQYVPTAAIALKQGFGRLLRTHSDYGVVALLDARVHDKSYGRRLLASLPPARRVEDFEQVRAFWDNVGKG
jgi:ATP-dependent DNA helicase DinG